MRGKIATFVERHDGLIAHRAGLVSGAATARKWGISDVGARKYCRNTPFDEDGRPIHPLDRCDPNAATEQIQVSINEALNRVEVLRQGNATEIRIPTFGGNVTGGSMNVILEEAPLLLRQAVKRVNSMREIDHDHGAVGLPQRQLFTD